MNQGESMSRGDQMGEGNEARGLSRRSVLLALGAGAAGAGGLSFAAPALAAAPQPEIKPRSAWAEGLSAKGSLEQEAPGDVKILIVHHSETPNGYAASAAPRTLRSMYEFHTGPKKGWPDIAYNFLVDAHGTIWEGRTGSLAGPVRGSATGGSQGFSQLACFIGNHTSTPPTQAAQQAMISLLAWLAGRYSINLNAGKSITFTSRGSNLWPKGETVTSYPIVGHREMSSTTCPGDACFPLIRGSFLPAAAALVGSAQPAPATSSAAPTQTPSATASPSPTSSSPSSSSSSTSPSSSPSESPSTSAAPSPTGSAAGGSLTVDDDKGGVPWGSIAIGGGAVAAVVGGVAAAAAGRARDDVPDLSADPLD